MKIPELKKWIGAKVMATQVYSDRSSITRHTAFKIGTVVGYRDVTDGRPTRFRLCSVWPGTNDLRKDLREYEEFIELDINVAPGGHFIILYAEPEHLIKVP